MQQSIDQLKMQLIQKIISTQDKEVLQAISTLLGGPKAIPTDALLEVLGDQTEQPLDQDAKELQQSIDDVFGV